MVGLLPAGAEANGRFPSAQQVLVGPGRSALTLVVRATFGLVVSDDGGRSFQFLCEDVFEYPDGYDPPLGLGAEGGVLVGVPTGLLGTTGRCAPRRRPELDGYGVVDLTQDGSGRRVYASLLTRDAMPSARVARSDDGGERFVPGPQVFPGVRFDTVDVAPSEPDRVYAAGTDEAGSLGVWRSEDGGQRWARTAARFGGAAQLFLAGVDPSRPAVVYARAVLAEGTADGGGPLATALLRSTDGGESFRELVRTHGPMRGFALAGDGRLWVGGPDARDGLLRSDDDGVGFRRVAPLPVQCLRWHAGALYVCDAFRPRGALLHRWVDGEASASVLVRYDQVTGPPRCAASTPVGALCDARWAGLQRLFAATPQDAAVTDAGPPAPPRPPSDCGCGAGAGRGPPALAVAFILRRRRRPRRGP
ncbi:MAG: hypothetical protein HY909_19410 [Deltaproteobacteria bacterium]|nr:hypothetical protein [Deltaproteobacteria bacterium]